MYSFVNKSLIYDLIKCYLTFLSLSEIQLTILLFYLTLLKHIDKVDKTHFLTIKNQLKIASYLYK